MAEPSPLCPNFAPTHPLGLSLTLSYLQSPKGQPHPTPIPSESQDYHPMTSLPSRPLMATWVMVRCLACLWRVRTACICPPLCPVNLTQSLPHSGNSVSTRGLGQKDKPAHTVPLQSGCPLSCLFFLGKCYFSASPGKPAPTLVGIIAPLLLLPCTLHEAVSITPAPSWPPVTYQ